jgi:hypothetical protein
MADIYYPTERMKIAAQAIADLPPCQYAHRLTVDQILLTLADHDFWPDVVRDMVADPAECS